MPLCPHCRQILEPDGGCPGCGVIHDARGELATVPADFVVPLQASIDIEGEPPAPDQLTIPLADLQQASDPLLGRLVADRFRVQQLVGTGGMGKVYKALQQGLERPVALKLLHNADSLEALTKKRFHREARAASRLNHPGVAAVYDFGEWEGQLYIAMEYIEGESLYQTYLRDFPLAPARLVSLLVQVCDALAAAHARGIVHRDLKPENIMVIQDDDGQEQVKVVDFGLAILVGPEAEQRFTKEGIISGTPAYMSPEQVQGGEMDARTDLYSLGVILYEQLTAQLPFSGETATELVVKHLFSDPEPPSAKSPEAQIHPALDALVLDALAKDPEARPPSAMGFRLRLLSAGELIRTGQQGDLLSRRKAAPGAGGRETRAAAMGIPRVSLPTPRETGEVLPWVLVIEPATSKVDSLTVTLRANQIRASGPGSLEDLLSRDETPAYDAVVVDLLPDAGGVLDHLAPHLDGGALSGVPLVVVGPADSFAVMSRALELGLADYVPATEVVRKLPRVLRRLWRRRLQG